MEGKVVAAMEALSPHTWSPVIRGTAAAIALQSAKAVYANMCIQEVRKTSPDLQCKAGHRDFLPINL